MKIEYLVAGWQRGRGLTIDDREDIPENGNPSAMLSVLGGEGWSLAFAQEVNASLTVLYFQRPLDGTAAKRSKK